MPHRDAGPGGDALPGGEFHRDAGGRFGGLVDLRDVDDPPRSVLPDRDLEALTGDRPQHPCGRRPRCRRATAVRVRWEVCITALFEADFGLLETTASVMRPPNP